MGKGVKKSKNGETSEKADKGLAYFDELNFPRSFKEKEKCHNFKFNTLRPKKVRCRDEDQRPLRISGERALYNLLKSKQFRHEPYIHCRCSYDIGDYRNTGVVSDVCPKPALVPLRFCKKMKKYNEKEDIEPELNVNFPMRPRRDRACERLMRQTPRCPYLPKDYATAVKLRVPQFACIPKPIYDTFKCRVSVGVCISDPSICTLLDRSNIDFCAKDCKIQSKEKIQKQKKHEEKAPKNNFLDKLKKLLTFWKSKNKDKTHTGEEPQKLKVFPAKKEPGKYKPEHKFEKKDGPEKITFLDVMKATCKKSEEKVCEEIVDIKEDSDKEKNGMKQNANEKYKPPKKSFLEKVKSIIPFWGSRKDKTVRKGSSQSFKVFSDKKTSLKEIAKPEKEVKIEESVSFLEIMAATCTEPDRDQVKEVKSAEKISFIDVLEATCHEPERDKYPFGKPKKKAKVDLDKREKSPPKCEESPPKREESPPKRKETLPKREESLPKREESPPKRKKSRPKRKETSSKRKKTPRKREESPPKREESPPKREESPPKKVESPNKKEVEAVEKISFIDVLEATCHEPERDEYPYGKPKKKAKVDFDKREKSPQKFEETLPKREESPPKREEISPKKEVKAVKKISFIDILEATCHEPERDEYPYGKPKKKAKVDFDEREKSPPKREESPPKREESPPKREESPPKRKETLPKREKSPPKSEEIPPKREKSPPKSEEIPPKREESPPKMEEIPPKSTKPEKLESTPKVKRTKAKLDKAAKSKKSKGKRRGPRNRKQTDSEDEAVKEFLRQVPSSDIAVPKKKNLKKKK